MRILGKICRYTLAFFLIIGNVIMTVIGAIVTAICSSK